MIICVCEFCAANTENPVIEINFIDKKMYFVCPECKKRNEAILGIKRDLLPKTRRLPAAP